MLGQAEMLYSLLLTLWTLLIEHLYIIEIIVFPFSLKQTTSTLRGQPLMVIGSHLPQTWV